MPTAVPLTHANDNGLYSRPIRDLTAEQIVERDTRSLQAWLARAKGDPERVARLAARMEESALRSAEAAAQPDADRLAWLRIAGRQATSAQILRASLGGRR